ncbi:fibronectin type III domain-containing protein, partial [Tumebacillus permanentifrigoris]
DNGDGKVSLQWQGVNGVTEYHIYQDGELVLTTPAGTTTATLTGLTNNQVYRFSVSAANAIGDSLHSAEVLAMPYNNDQWLNPIMTSNTSPLGAVTTNPSNGTAYLLFDHNDANSISLAGGKGIIEYDYQTPTRIHEYTMMPLPGYLTRMPKSWTFEGFNGTDWVILDTQQNVTPWTVSRKYFTFQNDLVFSKYRLNITGNNGDASYLTMSEIQLLGTYETPATPKGLWNTNNGDGKVSLQWQGVNGVTEYHIYQDGELVLTTPAGTTTATLTGLTNNQVYRFSVSAANAIGDSLHSAEVLAMPYNSVQWLNPIMTSNTSPSGAVTTSPSNGTAYYLFDHNDTNYITLAGRIGTIEYDYQTPKAIHEYTMIPYQGYLTRMPKSWKFEGFNGTDWVVLDTQQNVSSWTTGTRKYFTIQNDLFFSKYRLNITENNGDINFLTLSEIQFLGN